jgi:uncharacterized membrane protein YhaH (DUF805 family)
MIKAAFSFHGRSRRLGFRLSFLMLFVYELYVGILNFGELPEWYWGIAASPLIWLFLSQGIRRCHDLGKPWWYLIIPFYVFLLLFVPGQRGSNQYGADPRT